MHSTPAGRKQIKLQIAREAGLVREIQIQRVPTGDATKLENLLTLDREASARLIDLIQTLQYIPVEGGESTVRLDDQTIRDFFRDPDALHRAYRRNPATFRSIIENDPSAEDLVAIAHRREVVAHFRQLLDDEQYFEAQRLSLGRDVGKEGVWQALLEAEPWILGITLSGQLLTSWDDARLEQVVAGFSVGGPAKRTDALMQTNGQIRSLVFAEIKHHDTPLITNEQYKSGAEYRPGCWPPSVDLAGGVTQLQQTVLLAREQLGEALEKLDDAGAETGEKAYIVRPRSYLIIGHLRKLRGPRKPRPSPSGSTVVIRAHDRARSALWRAGLGRPVVVPVKGAAEASPVRCAPQLPGARTGGRRRMLTRAERENWIAVC